jgi:hypothetical protein
MEPIQFRSRDETNQRLDAEIVRAELMEQLRKTSEALMQAVHIQDNMTASHDRLVSAFLGFLVELRETVDGEPREAIEKFLSTWERL